ncbi:hypothetical protein CONPUDRAFT_82587 [Coniophora puteana RWD-64-598 SS2]|uniref:Uncharacterized protein n=1 Tax=Coniophora puteana (strain RWD-64-598) TaxID=741705 RepID=A0A5M3MML1_CONPW|nr:uncharacterized protein CONPUDRAFT_82587 [Coniophora puteana RWD-64-598 SS2]EIW80276.1 hypothetical protein CONPUDRAFT_82587 [Coniophora puteana RWD-64-598 SS2]
MPAPTIILSAKAPELPTEAPTASDVTLPAAASTIADAPVISLEDRSATLAPIEDTSAVLATSTATATPAENVEAPPPDVVSSTPCSPVGAADATDTARTSTTGQGGKLLVIPKTISPPNGSSLAPGSMTQQTCHTWRHASTRLGSR